ncbi:hypothetical protein TNIN_110861 [Trichonephila inaurata madagascariensis]|uniref:Uncharacterized protein n=1 Tax=Trichonephila inaurata madagascariensis TaxID=2747483 RepID=A0A8X6XDT9_9ARAC|nr:hypothetical protein TNIN_110861 [Trichonephila inaurata madagascariensis]
MKPPQIQWKAGTIQNLQSPALQVTQQRNSPPRGLPSERSRCRGSTGKSPKPENRQPRGPMWGHIRKNLKNYSQGLHYSFYFLTDRQSGDFCKIQVVFS